jgi:putative hydrolase
MDMPFVFGSDAHISYEVGNFEHIEKLIEGMEIPEHLIVNTSVALLKGFLA